MYRPGPRRWRPRTCEKSGSLNVCGSAPPLRGRTIGLSMYVWAFGHIVLAATLRRCLARTGALFSWRTTHVEAASWRARVREARCLPSSSCGLRGVGPSHPRFQGVGLSAPASPPAWHELAIVTRLRGDGGAVHAFSWAGRRGGEAVGELSVVLVRRKLLPIL